MTLFCRFLVGIELLDSEGPMVPVFSHEPVDNLIAGLVLG